MNSADCHPKPDPHVNLDYPCFVCGTEVLDDHAGIHCDDYHCVPHKLHQYDEQHIQHTIKIKHIMDMCKMLLARYNTQ